MAVVCVALGCGSLSHSRAPPSTPRLRLLPQPLASVYSSLALSLALCLLRSAVALVPRARVALALLLASLLLSCSLALLLSSLSQHMLTEVVAGVLVFLCLKARFAVCLKA